MMPLKSLISERQKALPKSCKCQFCNRFEAHELIDNIKDNIVILKAKNFTFDFMVTLMT